MRAGSVHSALGRAEWAQLHERKTKFPAGPDWLHEIKHGGNRLIVQREGKRVRQLTRSGNDWSDRYPRCETAQPHY